MAMENGERIVEKVIKIHVKKLLEGVYLATSDDVPGLVVQGRTVLVIQLLLQNCYL
ncbi:MAG: hypothetical protein ACFFCW_35280 [Candidatus Hodarchaeota archaeon]